MPSKKLGNKIKQIRRSGMSKQKSPELENESLRERSHKFKLKIKWQREEFEDEEKVA